MIAAILLTLALQTTPSNDLAAEAERLGRYSTLFALCEPFYASNIEAGRRLADDFELRSADAGWTSDQRMEAYDRGRSLERADLGIVLDVTGVAPQEARRRLREMYPRLKRRCGDLATEVPGAISNVAAGDRRLDAEARRYR